MTSQASLEPPLLRSRRFCRNIRKRYAAPVDPQTRERCHASSTALGSANQVDATKDVGNNLRDNSGGVVTAKDLRPSPDGELDGPVTSVVEDMIPGQSREMEATRCTLGMLPTIA